jgi:hypothetical protein
MSPLLSNIVLDELDWELERRGHRFVRYADDCNILVRSVRAGQRVMASIRSFLERRMQLKVNEEKSGVRQPHEVHFLGFRFQCRPEGCEMAVLLSAKSERRLRTTVREMTAGRLRRSSSSRLAAATSPFLSHSSCVSRHMPGGRLCDKDGQGVGRPRSIAVGRNPTSFSDLPVGHPLDVGRIGLIQCGKRYCFSLVAIHRHSQTYFPGSSSTICVAADQMIPEPGTLV